MHDYVFKIPEFSMNELGCVAGLDIAFGVRPNIDSAEFGLFELINLRSD